MARGSPFTRLRPGGWSTCRSLGLRPALSDLLEASGPRLLLLEPAATARRSRWLRPVSSAWPAYVSRPSAFGPGPLAEPPLEAWQAIQAVRRGAAAHGHADWAAALAGVP